MNTADRGTKAILSICHQAAKRAPEEEATKPKAKAAKKAAKKGEEKEVP